MSIPPLVCSTPPPPDQCEDDKHIDEFDLQYRLSPDDDDENDEYNYGNFSNFNHFNHPEANNEDSEQHYETVTKKTDHNIIENITKHPESSPNEENFIDKVNFEDVAIEDLNLKVEQENELVDQVLSHDSNELSDNYGITCFPPHIESPDKRTISAPNLVTEDDKVENTIQESNDVSTFSIIGVKSEIDHIEQSGENEILTQNKSPCEESEPEIKTCDDFDDFEDFKFTTNNNYSPIENTANPWESCEAEDATFGDFKANFDGTEHEDIHNEDSNKETIHHQVDLENNQDEEFGDFDDFKSSYNKDSGELVSPKVTVLNLQSNDNEGQIIESINNILFNIFTDDLPDSGTAFEGNIETLLGETWHYLKEVDIRQPYIVYWNNSLGQKTLLKALCIDSRNILFGPKWNSLMPKYATTLSGAPLKPQKPTTPTSPLKPDSSVEQSKDNNNLTWTDPFTSSGQEYTYAEALLLDLEHLMTTLDQMAHKQSTLKISELLSTANNLDREKTSKDSRHEDLDVFGNSNIESKLDKIYSSTLSVQPLRHINLPDTHIFTPTDSETPRSKTIHYDRPLPQSMEDEGSTPETSASQNTNIENSDDYWEFQDFKGTTESAQPEETRASTVNSIPKNVGVTLQSQLLQPVKVEPIMPTLNWPDPGEVKETFDDFSDFISSTNWNNDSSSNTDAKGDQPSSNITQTLHSVNGEDEFETFQSAPVPAFNHIKLDAESLSPKMTQVSDQASYNIPLNTLNYKTDEIFPPNNMQNHNNVVKNIPMNVPSKASSVNTSILKPINASPSVARPQQFGQILQPLSLESYSQINWPKPGIDLQNLSSFNPLESLETLKTDSGSSGTSKGASPVHKVSSNIANETFDDEIWGDFVSSKPNQAVPKKSQILPDDDEWTDFVSSPSLSQNSLKTISFNVETNSNMQKKSNQTVSKNSQTKTISFNVETNSNMQKKSNQTVSKNSQIALDIPVLNYVTPKSNSRGMCVDKHFQNL